MIQIQTLTKRFDGADALRELSMQIPLGSVCGLVGPNGAGKSTLLRCISGVYRPDGGQVLLQGQPVWENPAVKGRRAYLPDELYYFVSSSLRDLTRFYQGFYPRFDRELFRRLGQVFPIDPDQPIRRLSKGMQKQAFFWLALSLRPEVLLLDEPVDGLDPVMRRQLWSLILSQVEQHGTTVVISSHNLRELEDVCDRVGILDRGKLLLERSLNELQAGFIKLQLVFRDGAPAELPPELPVLHHSVTGKIHTYILRTGQEQAAQAVQALVPIFYDILPLTLEEIFIYELGGAAHDIREILL